MPLTNAEIATHVEALVLALVAEAVVKPKDQPVLDAGKALIINVLQNLNEIAATARGRQP